jgi:hypothetical protein
LDRILFGSNTILVFKYPLLKRKMQQIKTSILEKDNTITDDELDIQAKKILVEEGLI